MFNDPVYDGLDDISRMVTPTIDKVSEIISCLPDTLDVDYDLLKKILSRDNCGNINSISVNDIIHERWQQDLFSDMRERYSLGDVIEAISSVQMTTRSGVYTLNIDEGSMIDFDEGCLVGNIQFIRVSNGRSEEEIKNAFISKIHNVFVGVDKNQKTRINEIAKIFDLKEVLSQRGTRAKIYAFRSKLGALVVSNELNIRDTNLQDRFISWLDKYVKHGSLAAMSNICRLKILARGGNPIYSIDKEEQCS